MENIPPPSNPLQIFLQGLTDSDPVARVRAADSITLAAEEGANTSVAVPTLASLLGDVPAVAESAARALYACFLKGGDLSSVLPMLNVALGSPTVEVRAVAARILSRYKMLRGEEAPLQLHLQFKVPPAARDSSWTVNVSHRRTYAARDDPVQGEPPRACGACNSENTQCIYLKTTPEDALPGEEFEFKCNVCGKYTIYVHEVW
ncbi:MAG: hypothetical protein RBG13Loki_3224 [Promethearchaeota archaeon CR_4]|nr:MAG: hypothetical protein RBG13Loki_3224 [Candidatus Lokiarchaeota archaeon CR_4]